MKKNRISVFSMMCICIIGLSIVSMQVLGTSETITEESPGQRHGHGMVFVENLNAGILFGGRQSNDDVSPLNDIWKYDFSNKNWSIVETFNTPTARFNHGMIYIPSIHSILIYGGFNTTNTVGLTDTWILNLTSLEWREISSPQFPLMQSDCGITYDSVNNWVLIFGGFEGSLRSDQLWKFDVSHSTWEFQDTVNPPTRRYGAGFVFNAANSQFYLFGGRSQIITSDFYCLDAELDSWQTIHEDEKPYHRYWHSMVYASNSNQIILFGGESGIYDRGMLNDTWIYSFDSNSWEEVTSSKTPEARIMSPMVFSSNLNKVFVYGGIGNDYEQVFEDFWEFDCVTYTWIEVNPNVKNNIPIPMFAVLLSLCVGIAIIVLKTKKLIHK